MLKTHATPHLQVMGDEEDGLAPQQDLEALGEDVSPHVDVQRRQRVVQQEDVAVAVDGPCQADPLLLPPAQRQPAVANLKEVGR